MKYQPGTIAYVESYRVNNTGEITLVTINDGYKINLARPPIATGDIEALRKLMINTNFLDY